MSEWQLLTPQCPLQGWEEFCSVFSQQVSGRLENPTWPRGRAFHEHQLNQLLQWAGAAPDCASGSFAEAATQPCQDPQRGEMEPLWDKPKPLLYLLPGLLSLGSSLLGHWTKIMT